MLVVWLYLQQHEKEKLGVMWVVWWLADPELAKTPPKDNTI